MPRPSNPVPRLPLFRGGLNRSWLLVVALFFALSCRGFAQISVFVSQADGAIYAINDATGATTAIHTADTHRWNGAAYDPVNKLIYMSDTGVTSSGYTTIATQRIYSYNALTNVLTQVGVINNQYALNGAGWYNGYYYTVPIGTNTLVGYNLAAIASGTGVIAPVSTLTLPGLLPGTATGVYLGDIEFIGNNMYMSGVGTAGGAQINANQYILYKYAISSSGTNPVISLSGTGPSFSVLETGTTGIAITGPGLTYDGTSLLLISGSSAPDLFYVNQTTGALTFDRHITGFTGGAGDYTAGMMFTPEPSTLLGGFAAAGMAVGTVIRRRSRRRDAVEREDDRGFGRFKSGLRWSKRRIFSLRRVLSFMRRPPPPCTVDEPFLPDCAECGPRGRYTKGGEAAKERRSRFRSG